MAVMFLSVSYLPYILSGTPPPRTPTASFRRTHPCSQFKHDIDESSTPNIHTLYPRYGNFAHPRGATIRWSGYRTAMGMANIEVNT